MSSTWFTSLDRRSASATIKPMNCWRCAPSMAGSSRISSAKARMDVSGVRSSCVTDDMKSSFNLSRLSSWRFAARTCEASSSMRRMSAGARVSSSTTEATTARAEALPMAPASWVSTWCTSWASAAMRSMRSRPRWRATSVNRRWAASAPRKRAASCCRPASVAWPRQNTGAAAAPPTPPARSNTSTNSSAWPASRAVGARASDTATYRPALTSRLHSSACVRLSRPVRPNNCSGRSSARPNRPSCMKAVGNQPDLAIDGSISV